MYWAITLCQSDQKCWQHIFCNDFYTQLLPTLLFRPNLLNTKRENVGYTDHTWKNQNGSSNQAAATATNLVDRSFQFEMTSTRHCNICDKRTTENLQEHIFKLSLPKATPSKEGLPQPEGIQLLLNKTMDQVWPLIRCFESSCYQPRSGRSYDGVGQSHLWVAFGFFCHCSLLVW